MQMCDQAHVRVHSSKAMMRVRSCTCFRRFQPSFPQHPVKIARPRRRLRPPCGAAGGRFIQTGCWCGEGVVQVGRAATPLLSDDSGLLQHNRTRMMEVRYNVVAWRFLCRSHFHSFTTFLKSFPAVLVLFLKFPFEAPPKCHFVK